MSIVTTAQRLRERRMMSSLNQQELARIVGISHTQIARYEKGENDPTGEILVRLAQALNTSVDYLVGLTNDPLSYRHKDLSTKEQEALFAWRRGDRETAATIILTDKTPTKAGVG